MMVCIGVTLNLEARNEPLDRPSLPHRHRGVHRGLLRLHRGVATRTVPMATAPSHAAQALLLLTLHDMVVGDRLPSRHGPLLPPATRVCGTPGLPLVTDFGIFDIYP